LIQYVYIRNILFICRGRKLEERELAASTINEGGAIDEQEEEKERGIER
jgi:hypothetical protein